jgi:hypothetical protein
MASFPLFKLKSHEGDEQAYDDSTRDRSEAVTDGDGGTAERSDSDSRNGLWFWEIE